MKHNFDLRMKGADRDVIVKKSTEIVHSLAGCGDEITVYLLPEGLERTIRISVHQRIFVNYFIFDSCENHPEPSLCAESSAESMIGLESPALKALILHLLELKETVTPELQRHYIDIIFHYIQMEIGFDRRVEEASRNKQLIMGKLREYIDQNIKRNLSVKSLTDVCHMSERSLYYLFRESESTTPLSYIQQRKIALAHREITAGSAVRSITQIAMDYGFTNMGRFSQLYRKQVGELPSVTRSRAVEQPLRA
ncbi:AraC family transcriptional regulator [Amphritea pacifica]|uniref:AraC family transcriptional regulator n=1 Tax=Amphritea pacifica TaxID=2811233 RepID=A0ABS2WC21_9GAMM|nr:AraC family transcriptional regulator [Amphritea pacifica]MBN0989266.1 AraC family transcriptional regulator [Amphritea pacifica]MBN1007286.1 AraC family transcriptional regulator [Amphritea pacifica]